ncbi:MAG: hypothetical protein J6B95_07050 [Oscillospiraceae bacterium]|nr:hypothetical protein [Oscillospiraceae bacterium]
MKRFIQCVCLTLVVSMLLAFPALAVDNRASNFFLSSSVYLYKTSGTTFEAWFEVDALGTMDELGASLIKIQRSSDGVNWTTMKTVTKEDNSDLICKNTGMHAACITYTGTVGYYYRAYIELYAKNSSGRGEWYRYTSSMKL